MGTFAQLECAIIFSSLRVNFLYGRGKFGGLTGVGEGDSQEAFCLSDSHLVATGGSDSTGVIFHGNFSLSLPDGLGKSSTQL